LTHISPLLLTITVVAHFYP